jgi:hypothetical protein
MYDRYSDFAELRPTGEASHIPDTRLDEGCEGTPRRQRVATNSGGYPDAPTATDGECRFCGASVSGSQMKCRFCLSNHLGSGATKSNDSARHPMYQVRRSYSGVRGRPDRVEYRASSLARVSLLTPRILPRSSQYNR